jgi:hypothetical protein
LAKGNIEKFTDIQEGILDQKNLSLNDILDPEELDSTLKRPGTPHFDDELGNENEVNQLIEDIWEDFSKNVIDMKTTKLESVIKDEVNDRLRQYLKENSEMLSGGIERHIKNLSVGKDVHLTEGRLNNLNLLSNERQ